VPSKDQEKACKESQRNAHNSHLVNGASGKQKESQLPKDTTVRPGRGNKKKSQPSGGGRKLTPPHDKNSTKKKPTKLQANARSRPHKTKKNPGPPPPRPRPNKTTSTFGAQILEPCLKEKNRAPARRAMTSDRPVQPVGGRISNNRVEKTRQKQRRMGPKEKKFGGWRTGGEHQKCQ